MSNIYLCAHDYTLIKDLIDYANKQNDFNIVGITTSILEDIEQLVDLKADIFILQFYDEPVACTRLLSKLFMESRLHGMQKLLLFQELDTNTIHLLLQYDIKNFMVEPYTCAQLIRAIQQESSTRELEEASSWNMDAFTTKILHELGISMHLDGYRYLATCSLLVYQSFPGKRLIIGDIYLECAKMHATTASRVEKSIRTAVNYAYRTQPEKVCIYNSKPTNSQIVLYISEKLKLFHLL